jgi:protein CpxP
MSQFFKKYKVLILIIVGLLILNAVLIGYLIFPKRSEYVHPHAEMNRSEESRNNIKKILVTVVGFDSNQINQYQQLQKDHWKMIRPQFGELRNAKNEFFSLLSSSLGPEDARVLAAADSIAHKQRTIDLATYAHFMELRTICRADQQMQFDSLLQQVILRMNGPGRRPQPKE